jgi:hypothetical protein
MAQIDEPGYTPHGMSGARLEEWKRQEEEKQEARRAAAHQEPKPAAAAPVTPPPQPRPEAQPVPAFELPQLPVQEEDGGTTEIAAALQDDTLGWLQGLAADQGVELPTNIDLSSLGAQIEPINIDLAPIEATPADPLNWLESLAEQETPGIPALEELAKVSAPAEPPVLETSQSAQIADPLETGANPLEWLETLARRQGAAAEELTTGASLDIPLPEGVTDNAPGYTDYSFESPADLPAAVTAEEPAPEGEALPELDDPEAWLDKLASGRAYAEEVSSEREPEPVETPGEDIIAALNKGEDISAEAMQAWMEKQFDRAEEIGDVEEEVDLEAPPVKAEIPDWLLEQMGNPPPAVAETPAPPVPASPAPTPAPADESLRDLESLFSQAQPSAAPDLESLFNQGGPLLEQEAEPEEAEEEEEAAAPVAADLPDWLKEGLAEDEEGIFASEEEPGAAEVSAVALVDEKTITEELAIDTNDPWVEAFELERTQGMADINTVPDWYAQRLGEAPSAPAAQPAAPEPEPAAPAAALAESNLPAETELSQGEPEPLPDWLSQPVAAAATDWLNEVVPVAPAASGEMPDWLKDTTVGEHTSAAFSEELPDWLKEAEATPAEEVPDWLKDTLSTDEHAIPVVDTTISAPPAPPAPRAISPAPVPPAAAINVASALASARSKVGGGDVTGSLQDYEAVVRANAELDAVAGDLSKLIEDKTHKENPAIHRILGDTLMRQGKLQDALDTYRKALNLL